MHDETTAPKERLIAAALQVIAERGFEAATVKEVAQAAHVNQGLVHYYFGSKEALLLAALDRASDDMGRTMQALRLAHTQTELGSAALAAVRERVRQMPERYRLSYELYALGLRSPALKNGLQRLLVQVRGGIRTTLESARPSERGEDLDTTALAAVLLACFDGLALQYLADPAFDLDGAYEILAQLLDPFLHPQ